jgi:hypothetical protein
MPNIILKNVGQDLLDNYTKTRNALVAIEELIWNSLDADATRVEVKLSISDIGGLEQIVVADNGIGMSSTDCEHAFSSLGNSRKLKQLTTPRGRMLHGKHGKGRFRAFGVGRTVTWLSRYKDKETIKEFSIRGVRSSLKSFMIGEEKASTSTSTGVEVTIVDIDSGSPSLARSEVAAADLSRRLALYLKQYPGISIVYDDFRVDPEALLDNTTTYIISVKDKDGNEFPGELTIIEWKISTDRALYLCDENGFALDEKRPGVQTPGFSFTAYLKSVLISELERENALSGEGDRTVHMHPVVDGILNQAKDIIRKHFREREAARLGNLVKQWQDENVYPYNNIAQDPLAKAEREVFDICAIKVHEYLPGFGKSEPKSKRLTFRLIREALERSPDSLHQILQEVLNLPKEQQDDLANILTRTKLGAMINAAKTVIDRLDFVSSLDSLLFGDFKKTLLERKQLHRILAQELWIFGEQYSLGVDDQSLKALLEKHISLLGREALSPADTAEVTDLEGKNRIVDLMLYNQYPLQTPDHFEHLVIELKRPDCKLGKEEIGQIENYAFSVADDERFDKKQTKWTFILIGNDLSSFGENRCKVQGREYGHIHASDDGSVNVYVRKWSTVIGQSKWRYRFFKEKLELQVTTEDGLKYLHKKHSKHVPDNS